jgi:SSS family solute:Na+ symporter
VAQSRMGLLANGIVKVPMQFTILLTGAMIFVFYQFVTPPLFFNPVETAHVKNSSYAEAYQKLEMQYGRLHQEKQDHIREMLDAIQTQKGSELDNAIHRLRQSRESELGIRNEATELIQKANPDADTNDINYIFLSFVINFLPVGLVGLILAAILSASMSSTSAELNALASVTVVDIYKRVIKRNASDRHYLIASKLATVFWGLYAINFALFANRLGSLIEAVNILGSLFYGTILGIFLIAFYFKKIGGNATFIAAVVAELTVLACYFFTEVPYLWFNVIGCVILIILAHLINPSFAARKQQ